MEELLLSFFINCSAVMIQSFQDFLCNLPCRKSLLSFVTMVTSAQHNGLKYYSNFTFLLAIAGFVGNVGKQSLVLARYLPGHQNCLKLFWKWLNIQEWFLQRNTVSRAMGLLKQDDQVWAWQCRAHTWDWQILFFSTLGVSPHCKFLCITMFLYLPVPVRRKAEPPVHLLHVVQTTPLLGLQIYVCVKVNLYFIHH